MMHRERCVGVGTASEGKGKMEVVGRRKGHLIDSRCRGGAGGGWTCGCECCLLKELAVAENLRQSAIDFRDRQV